LILGNKREDNHLIMENMLLI